MSVDTNLDVIRTLVVDENPVLCTVLLAFHRAVVRRERERVGTNEGYFFPGLRSKPAATTVIVLGALLP
jgi:hypothetical protein